MVSKPAMFHELRPTVEVEYPPYAALETAVADALGSDSAVDTSSVTVTASGSTITLTGSVTTKSEIVRAGEVAARVEGVQLVDNRLSA